MQRTVAPFHLTIGPAFDDGGYAVRALAGDGEADARLTIPATLEALTARALRPGSIVPDVDGPEIGRILGRALFTSVLRDLLLRSARIAAQSGERLQIQLQIVDPALATLPWEWLALGGGGEPWAPALRDNYTLVRVSRRLRPAATTRVVGPLRILACGTHSEQGQLDALEAALGGAIRDGLIDLRVLEDATPADLAQALEEEETHILHCAMPVQLTPSQTLEIDLERGYDAFDLGELLDVHERLRLVTITGAHGNGRSLVAGPPLLGALLLNELRPAAISLSGPLPAALSARFAAACYTELAANQAIDLAVTAGRRTLARHGDAWGFAQLRIAPGLEQLFSVSAVPARRKPRSMVVPAIAAAVLALALLLAWQLLSARIAAGPGNAAGPAITTTIAPSRSFNLQEAIFGRPEPTLTPAPSAIPSATPLPIPSGYVAYTAIPSDTFELIAERFDSLPAAIAAENLLDVDAGLRPGRQIIVPVYQLGVASAVPVIVTRGNPAAPRVALTFDIEIDDASLYAILDVMRTRQVKGTFFLTGRWVQSYPDAARAIVADGHELANHSLSHPFFSRIGLDGAAVEVAETERIIRDTTGVTSRPYFRFPYGDSTADAVLLLARAGYLAYHWSADDPAIDGWITRVSASPPAGYGGILLMHGRLETAARLSGWIDQLQALGLEPTTLSETLR